MPEKRRWGSGNLEFREESDWGELHRGGGIELGLGIFPGRGKSPLFEGPASRAEPQLQETHDGFREAGQWPWMGEGAGVGGEDGLKVKGFAGAQEEGGLPYLAGTGLPPSGP